MNIAILGGGIAGLGVAYYLSKSGFKVDVFEKEKQVGGIAESYRIDNKFIEKYYHVSQNKDHLFYKLCEELGIKEKIVWNSTSIGFYHKGKIIRLDNPVDLLFFSPLPFFERIKFGIRLMQISKKQDWKSLDKVKAEKWLIKAWGQSIYKNLYKPLLNTKFGVSMDNASAAFVFGRVRAAFLSKGKNVGKEKYAYVKGGYQLFIDKLVERIKEKKSRIFANSEIKDVVKSKKGYTLKVKDIKNGIKSYKYDLVINAMPLTIFSKSMKKFPKETVKKVSRINYQGVVCLLLGLRKKLSDYWWINILDEKLPFGVIVEHSNLKGCDHFQEKLVYIAKYLSPDDELLKKNEKEIFKIYTRDLKKVFPNFDERDVIWSRLSRSKFGTPLFDINYLERMPPDEVDENLYVTGSYKVYPDSRNINEIMKHSFILCEKILKDLKK